MATLFNIASDFEELFAQFDIIENLDFDTDADGNLIDGYGNIIENPVEYKESLYQAWLDTLEGIEIEFNFKAEQIALFIKDLKLSADAIEAEERNLRQRKEAKRKQIGRLKNILKCSMDKMGVLKIDMPKAKISIRNNPESLVVDDELGFINWAQQINDNLLKYSLPDIRKTEVKKLVQQGEVIPNVHLERGESVIIK